MLLKLLCHKVKSTDRYKTLHEFTTIGFINNNTILLNSIEARYFVVNIII